MCYYLKKEDAVKKIFKGDVLAVVKVGVEEYPFLDKKVIALFEGEVEGLYWYLYDYVEHYTVDVSEFDYDKEKIKPQDCYAFKTIDCEGKIKENLSDRIFIKEIIEVFSEKLQVEDDL